MKFLYVFIGGGMGSMLRYGISLLASKYHFATISATLVANSFSSLILGIAFATLTRSGANALYILIATGICGGFSTFSTFSLESYHLLLDHQYIQAGLNIIISCSLCIGMIGIGIYIGNQFNITR